MTFEDVLLGLAVAALSVCCLLGGAMVGWLTDSSSSSEFDDIDDEFRR